MSPYNPTRPRPPRWKLQLVSCASLPNLKVGGDERVRTDDPLLAKQVLSQLSYTPTVIPAFVLLPFESALQHPQNYTVQVTQTRICLYAEQTRDRSAHFWCTP